MGILTSCFAASARMMFFVHRALMGWTSDAEPFNWRAGDVMGLRPEEVGSMRRRIAAYVAIPEKPIRIGDLVK
jgi:hypothetical protein